jgi:acyl-CoA synthetase (AMP-forming)/AMP-acid ligase II
MAMIDFFDRGWLINPTGAAYIQDERTYTFDEVGTLSCQVANALLATGLPCGTKGAVWAANDTTAWTCALGIWRANMCWLPVGARNPADENQYVLDQFDCEILFYQSYFAPIIATIQARLPKIKHWICLDGESTEVANAIRLSDWIKDQPATKPHLDVDMDDVIAIVPTGGTTGLPKGVMNTHRTYQTAFAHLMINFPYTEEENPVTLAAAPMTHTSGLLSIPVTCRGGAVVILSKPDPTLMLAAIPKYRVTELFLPPTVIYRLLEIPGLNMKVDFSSLKYLIYGAAPMSVEKLKQAIEVFGPVMAGGYGQTEAGGTISTMPPHQHFVAGNVAPDSRLSSVGRPNPLVHVEIMDDHNNILPRGQSGEICLRGDLMMRGYYKDPVKTAETIIDGWLHTSDVGHMDEEGFLHITDRKKDMIISGGFNVYPSQIEQVIWGHPAVQDCAVIGVPDEKWGEAVKAVVELNAGQTVTAEEIMALCKEKLGSVMTPKTVDFTAQLPRSMVGKVLKKDLRAQYWKDSDRKI